MKKYGFSLFLASLLVIAFAAVAGSGRNPNDLPAPPAIGTMIEDFKLPDADGKEHSLSSLKGKNGTVLIFIATKCPVSNGYNERMEKLAQDYRAKGVNGIGINSNSTEPATEVKAHAAEKHLPFTIQNDGGTKTPDRLQSTSTQGEYHRD